MFVAPFAWLLGVLLYPPPPTSAPAETHLLIISIDGLRGSWAAHPEQHGLKLPTLTRLAARGAKAEGVLGVFPTVTYPSHTTLITGCYPTRHGIFGNEIF